MSETDFNTDSFRDLTFDLLSGIAHDSTKFDELNQAYLTKLHERADEDKLRQYTKDIYEKILSLQIVQTTPEVQLKNVFHENIVVVHFWTYSNIESTHVMQKMIGIDKRYSSAGTSIICVHSPKFEHEKNKANVQHAIQEQGLPFTVVNDNGLQVWKHVGCQVWPTVMVFGPDALPIYIFEGENHVQHLELFLVSILDYYKSSVRASRNRSSSSFGSISPLKAAEFRHPNNICVASNGQLFISFSGSNHIIHCDTDGKVIDVIGNGNTGMVDGEIHQSEFDSPRGLVEYNSCIYIADTNNHSIRVFDPNTRRVLTLIGTGRIGNDKIGGLKRTQQPIASPWDLCITESPFDNKMVLLISMTGHHQIWAYAYEETQWWTDVVLQKNSCSAIIGNGNEENRNSPDPMKAGLASPRGICNGVMNGEPVLFIADSYSSTIRVVTLTDGKVANLVGGSDDPTNLSAFGDLDGIGHNARLQYPIGVAFHYASSNLYITDSFNNKIKRIDMKNLLCSSYFVTDNDRKKKRGETNSSRFYEPCGLAILDHFLYVAEKNNSFIKRIDLDNATIVRHRFDLSETFNEERTFGSKQTYLTIELNSALQLRDGNTGTWIIEDEDGVKICDGELVGPVPDQILLDYVPRDKQVTQLKYELMVCKDNSCNMRSGVIEPTNQTDSTIEFLIKIDDTETSSD